MGQEGAGQPRGEPPHGHPWVARGWRLPARPHPAVLRCGRLSAGFSCRRREGGAVFSLPPSALGVFCSPFLSSSFSSSLLSPPLPPSLRPGYLCLPHSRALSQPRRGAGRQPPHATAGPGLPPPAGVTEPSRAGPGHARALGAPRGCHHRLPAPAPLLFLLLFLLSPSGTPPSRLLPAAGSTRRRRRKTSRLQRWRRASPSSMILRG